ncbi:hypothetical protein GUJ93_ZPchr0012g21446 [Zizania palustris]|uniref:Uncharacterized protein n=1 Tax=Zizania palustris TaxID=103762 RepID=A0A8J5WHK9_ZIZPA|nr:hypothetical protein GUJ93_ZPchr0012g21446 [Zizania palustris]
MARDEMNTTLSNAVSFGAAIPTPSITAPSPSAPTSHGSLTSPEGAQPINTKLKHFIVADKNNLSVSKKYIGFTLHVFCLDTRYKSLRSLAEVSARHLLLHLDRHITF